MWMNEGGNLCLYLHRAYSRAWTPDVPTRYVQRSLTKAYNKATSWNHFRDVKLINGRSPRCHGTSPALPLNQVRGAYRRGLYGVMEPLFLLLSRSVTITLWIPRVYRDSGINYNGWTFKYGSVSEQRVSRQCMQESHVDQICNRKSAPLRELFNVNILIMNKI